MFARSASGHAALREVAHRVLSGPEGKVAADAGALVEDVRSALWASKIVAYAQGLHQIRAAGEAYGWNVNLAEVARIWRGGCIIRARLLERIRQAYAGTGLPTLLADPEVAADLGRAQQGWRRVVALAATSGVPVPGFAAALAYYDTVRAQRLPAARYGDPGKMARRYDPAALRDGWNVLPDGERIFFVSNPAMGLWAHRSRFDTGDRAGGAKRPA